MANASPRPYAKDPLRAFKFRVEIEGISGAIGFQSVTGLGRTAEVIEYREGGFPETMNKIPGMITFENIVLERGKFAPTVEISANDLKRWADQVWDPEASETANEFRRNVTIYVYGRSFDEGPMYSWVAVNAWPTVFKVSDLSASDSSILIETMELAHECLIHSTANPNP